jgi:predicted aspartyl protease
MGLTEVQIHFANPAKPEKRGRLKLLVDSGAVYSVIPTRTLNRLGIEAHSQRSFILADGTEITRRIGDAMFFMGRSRGASPVIFGEKGDSALLGFVTLEALGMTLDPIRRELRPLPMILANHFS